jgi:restriction system protein
LLHRLAPRRFEQFVARIFDDMGYRVTLTPETRDGGFDMLVEAALPTGRLLTLVECKKWAPNRPVPIEIVRNLYGVLSFQNATQGLIVTTSRFTRDAQSQQDAVKYRMGLRDFEGISEWLKPYRESLALNERITLSVKRTADAAAPNRCHVLPGRLWA